MLADERETLFKKWLNDHKNLVFKVVKAYADSPEDQDDLFQEILMQLWSSIPGFRGNANETTWIYRVALNTGLMWRRSQSRKRKGHRRFVMDLSQLPQVDEDCTDSIHGRQIVEQLYTAIRKLPKIDASLVLMHLDSLSYQQMAEILGISTSNVGVKLNRAKKQLAQSLKGLLDDL
ncbi:MAG: RNA polymerase sigma factor [Planctomycetota bacterium]|jgi:RNA polymerase sigma-70 factor (ECF subfamily)